MRREPTYTPCHKCDRGGNGNAKDKCACGWRFKRANGHGCYLGEPITEKQSTTADQAGKGSK